jgi:hypothetical protein
MMTLPIRASEEKVLDFVMSTGFGWTHAAARVKLREVV